jgi:hypothetical protein
MTVTTTAPTDSSTIPAIGHHEAMDLLAHELQTTVDLLRGLDAADWTARTDCPAWDVRQLPARLGA